MSEVIKSSLSCAFFLLWGTVLLFARLNGASPTGYALVNILKLLPIDEQGKTKLWVLLKNPLEILKDGFFRGNR